MEALAAARRLPLSGTVVALSDVATPLGEALARRLAVEVVPLVIASVAGEVACAALAEVRRVRALNRIGDEPLLLGVDATTEQGMAAALRQAVAAHGRLDAVILVAWPDELPPSGQAIARLLGPLRAAAEALVRQGGGRLIIAADLGHDESAPPAACLACDAAVESVVRAAARTFGPDGICVNGVIVHPADMRTGRRLALAAGLDAVPRTDPDLAAAAGLTSLVIASAGLTGQVFRFGPVPGASPPEPVGLLRATAAPS